MSRGSEAAQVVVGPRHDPVVAPGAGGALTSVARAGSEDLPEEARDEPP
jgi:hypothetical protein